MPVFVLRTKCWLYEPIARHIMIPYPQGGGEQEKVDDSS